MKKNNRGLFRRDGTFVECGLSRLDTYSDVVEKIAKIFSLKSPSRLCLYRPGGGAVIPAEELTINNSQSVMWTLGHYMRVKHAGPDVIQLGIGPTDGIALESDSFDTSSDYDSSEEVRQISFIS